MIGNHLYNDRVPPGDNLAPTGGEPQLTDGQLQQKIQQLGFDSLPHLLNSLQKQQMRMQNGNHLQNRSRLLAAAQMKLPGLHQMEA